MFTGIIIVVCTQKKKLFPSCTLAGRRYTHRVYHHKILLKYDLFEMYGLLSLSGVRANSSLL